MQKCQEEQAREDSSQADGDTQYDASGKRTLPRLVLRTRFYDDLILEATGAHTGAAALQPLRNRLAGGKACSQVVLLGSGMDSRPWRLTLPPGVKWFEVDQADVLQAKDKLLRLNSVQTKPGYLTRLYRYPLRAASWAAVVMDLQQPGWAAALLAAGFDPSKPTVWVAEGLLYYLQPNSVPRILQEAAGVSAPGSVFSASVVLDSVNKLASGHVPANSAHAAILSKFVWQCPDDVHQFWGDNGWEVTLKDPWMTVARQYGHEPEAPKQSWIPAGVADLVRDIVAVVQ